MSSRTTLWDAVIVGAGPAGSTAARFAAQGGARVLLLERRERVGEPVQCAEHVPAPLVGYLKRPREVLVQPVLAMRTVLPDGTETRLPAPGWIVHRDRMDQDLAEQAVEAGATLWTGARAVAWDGTALTVVRGRAVFRLRPRVLVGADGPASSVGRWIGVRQAAFVHALQYRMPLTRSMATADVYFRDDCPGGYAWVFPKGGEANVGVGVDVRFGAAPSRALERFVDELVRAGRVLPERRGKAAGRIPVGGLLPLRRGRVLLVGDAAGQCHPLTGAGVPSAVLCGELAGRAVAKAVATGNLGCLAEYEEECRDLLGQSLARAAARRQALEPFWKASKARLSRALRRHWVAFETRTGSQEVTPVAVP